MTTIEVKCPKCGSNQVQKYGISESKKQRYICRNEDCPAKTFQLEHNCRGCEQGINETMIIMAANASRIRNTSRVLHISTGKVMSTLKKRNTL